MEELERNVFNNLKTEIIESSEKVVIQKDYRAIFLKEFTKELLLNINKIKIKESKNVENFNELSERLRKKILEQIEREYEYKEMRNQKIVVIPKMQQVKPLPVIPIIRKETRPIIKTITKEISREPLPQQLIKPQASIKQNISQPQPLKFRSIDEIINEIKKLLNDPRTMMIECVGKDKFLLIRTATRVMVTRIKLNEEEIKSIINKFSKETKIPIVNGLLNAIKDNLSISAIISDVAGSRFILKKVYLDS